MKQLKKLSLMLVALLSMTAGAWAQETVTGITWKLPTQDEWKQMFKANGNDDTSYTSLNNALATAGGNSSKLQDDGYWSSSETDSDNAYLVNLVNGGAAGPSVAKYNDAHVRACYTF